MFLRNNCLHLLASLSQDRANIPLKKLIPNSIFEKFMIEHYNSKPATYTSSLIIQHLQTQHSWPKIILKFTYKNLHSVQSINCASWSTLRTDPIKLLMLQIAPYSKCIWTTFLVLSYNSHKQMALLVFSVLSHKRKITDSFCSSHHLFKKQ